LAKSNTFDCGIFYSYCFKYFKHKILMYN
jgi:hypothetical protein